MSFTLNEVRLIGRLGGDPQLYYSTSGTPYCKFNLATDQNFKKGDGTWTSKTDWHRITLWDKNAERAAEQLKKGARVHLSGRISYNKYNDKDTGKEMTSCEIVGDRYIALDFKSDKSTSTQEPPAEEQPVPADVPTPTDEDLPF